MIHHPVVCKQSIGPVALEFLLGAIDLKHAALVVEVVQELLVAVTVGFAVAAAFVIAAFSPCALQCLSLEQLEEYLELCF